MKTVFTQFALFFLALGLFLFGGEVGLGKWLAPAVAALAVVYLGVFLRHISRSAAIKRDGEERKKYERPKQPWE